MENAVRKEFLIEGLCCGICAAKIEKAVRELEGVRSASLDFATGTLALELDGAADGGKIAARVGSVARDFEPEIEISEMAPAVPGRRVLYLSGLDCADCARRVEEAAGRVKGVKAASLSFAAQTLTIDTDDRSRLPALSRQVAEAVRRTDGDVTVSYTGVAEFKNPEKLKSRFYQAGILCGAALFAAAYLPVFGTWARFSFFLASCLLSGAGVFLRAVKNLAHGRMLDENFLMSVAAAGAFATGNYAEAAAVMLFYQTGEFLQGLAVGRSRRSIKALMDIRPDYANLLEGGQSRKVPPEEVGAGDLILVKPGEKLPLDGVVREGVSALDTSALTGESMPRGVSPGSEVLSGSVNLSGLLTVEVTREFGSSTVSRILDLVQNAGAKKAPTESFMTKFSRYYTPAVVFSAIALALLPPLLLPSHPFAQWINRALVFLVVSCPCALVISIPLSFFGGIGGASRHGILVKGGNVLEALNRVDTVAFDKTGTLTKGSFAVSRVERRGALSEEEMLYYAACAESFSSHPIALSIQKANRRVIDTAALSDYEEAAGHGVRVNVSSNAVLAGGGRLMERAGIPYETDAGGGTVVHLAVNGAYAGFIVIADELRGDSRQAVAALKALGVRRTVMLTGDGEHTAREIAAQAGVDGFYAGLLPGGKVERLEALEREKPGGGALVFVGDGINDAPVLARADIGVAMGGLGSDAAVEAADMVLMTDEPSKLVTAIRIARKTHRIVWQNIIFALSVKAVILLLGALGIATIWEAVFGDVGVALIAIFNAMRAMRVQ